MTFTMKVCSVCYDMCRYVGCRVCYDMCRYVECALQCYDMDMCRYMVCSAVL